jgi:hypothetical protein
MQEIQNQEREAFRAPDEEQRTGPAWESRHGIGLVHALLVTLGDSMLRPSRFFRAMRRDEGYLAPLVYAMILGSLSIVMSVIWELALFSARNPLLDAASSEEFLRMRPMLYGVTVILSPIVVTVLVFVSSAILHLGLLVLGGARQRFQTSFRVVCYSEGAGVLNLVPYLGAFVGSVWNLVLLAIGLRESHETTTFKAILAVLGVLVTWFVVIAALGLLVVASGFL